MAYAPTPSPSATHHNDNNGNASTASTLLQKTKAKIADKTKDTAKPNFQHLFAGSFAGMSARFILQPLDLVKVRLQVQDGTRGTQEYTGLRNAFTTIYRTDGIKGFYRGMSANLAGAGVSWGAYFFMYSNVKDLYRQHLKKSDPTVTKTTKLSAPAHLLCAAVSGWVTVLINNPLILIKTRLQLQGKDKKVQESLIAAGKSTRQPTLYKNPIDAFIRIVREEGFFSLWNGLGPSLLLVSNGAIQFMTYEELKKFAGKYVVSNEHDLGPLHFLVMGGLAKTFSATLTYPLAVIRSRLYAKNAQVAMIQAAAEQTSKSTVQHEAQRQAYVGFTDTIRKTYRKEGWRGFYRGLSVQLVKTAPSSAITFSIYEMVMRLVGGKDSTT
jgi:solute carrier family 25 folate transporter 32